MGRKGKVDNVSVVSIIKEDIKCYPEKELFFRPSTSFPEYPFHDGIYDSDNKVYGMVRESFHVLGMDSGNYGNSLWNPLGEVINPGNRVLIKPNLVMHRNQNEEGGLECLITHPSVVAPVIDYVCIALKGKGTIVIGDAPLQECNFEELVVKSGYKALVEYYCDKGIKIELKDFRNVKTFRDEKGVHFFQEGGKKDDNGILVSLDEESLFCGLEEERLKKLRITDYDPSIVGNHHVGLKHEYMVSRELLQANVVINMPKPKTHRKAGVTISLKNMVGINANKEYLPHHTLGSREEGGDCYLHRNNNMSGADDALDRKNIANSMQSAKDEINAISDFWKCYFEGKRNGERYYEGSWYGNDTIWRTISDLNRILFFADKNGVFQNNIQRRELIIADMVIAGEKEGPLEPSPKDIGIIACGCDPLWFDRAICTLMGFDYQRIPSLSNNILMEGKYCVSGNVDCRILSNKEEWNNRRIGELDNCYDFVPTKGWECALGNNEKEKLLSLLRKNEKKNYIFGAGDIGLDLCMYIEEKDPEIHIDGFFDNDNTKWGQEVLPGIWCNQPFNDENALCIIAVKRKNVQTIYEELNNQYKYEDLIIWLDEENRVLLGGMGE